jgi:hypothetical protein
VDEESGMARFLSKQNRFPLSMAPGSEYHNSSLKKRMNARNRAIGSGRETGRCGDLKWGWKHNIWYSKMVLKHNILC